MIIDRKLEEEHKNDNNERKGKSIKQCIEEVMAKFPNQKIPVVCTMNNKIKDKRDGVPARTRKEKKTNSGFYVESIRSAFC